MSPLEKAAKASYDAHPWGDEDAGERTWETLAPEWQEVHRMMARAVLEAIAEPDDEMMIHGGAVMGDSIGEVTNDDCGEIYRAMIRSMLDRP